MGIHTAEPTLSDEGYYGLGVHRAARVMSAAHGGQVLLSRVTSSVLEDAELDGPRLRDLGEHRLKDIDRPERLFQLEVTGLPATFPAPRTERPAPATPPKIAVAGEALIERSDALSTLEESLTNVAEVGTGRLVLVSGEAGVGKTTLLRRFCDQHRGSARILWGSCDPLFTPRPLGPLLDIAEVAGGDLTQVLNEGGSPHAVATALMRELESRTPTVLVLEDVHWADEATLDVVGILGRRVDAVPSLVVLSYRDDEVDRSHPLRMVLGVLANQSLISRLELTPLSRSAVAQLAEHHGVDADDLFVRTAGNPFFVREALAVRDAELPITVRDAVLARTLGLSEQAAAVLDAVAIVPAQVELWLLEALATDAVDGLDECFGVGAAHAYAQRDRVSERACPARRRGRASSEPTAPASSKGACRVGRPTSGVARPRAARAPRGSCRGWFAVLRYASAAGERAALVGAHREAAAQYARGAAIRGRPPAPRARGAPQAPVTRVLSHRPAR